MTRRAGHSGAQGIGTTWHVGRPQVRDNREDGRAADMSGPGPPESVAVPPEQRVGGLVPFVHAEDVERSIAFYYHLGFIVASVYKYRGRPSWAELSSEGAELMVTTDGDPIDRRVKVFCSTCTRE